MLEQFLVTEYFLTWSGKFLISNKSEQLEFKLEKNIGIQKHAGKVRKSNIQWTQQNFIEKILLKFSALSDPDNFEPILGSVWPKPGLDIRIRNQGPISVSESIFFPKLHGEKSCFSTSLWGITFQKLEIEHRSSKTI